ISDEDRVTPAGQVRVYETRDRGGCWRPRADGLPERDAYLTVLRQAFCHDGEEPLGLYFGAEQGTVFGSDDDGATWRIAAANLPPVSSVRVA
ncbi:MAG: exo-alpha-sialidase, partial [Thermoanaerobaculia bacterium]